MQERQVAREYFGPPSIVCCYRCIYGDTIRIFFVFNLFIVLLKYTAKPAGESSNIPPLYGISKDDTKQYVSEISRVPIGKNSRGTVRTKSSATNLRNGQKKHHNHSRNSAQRPVAPSWFHRAQSHGHVALLPAKIIVETRVHES